MGCLIAVVGGMWLGALYLGIDVEGTLFNALYEAELLDSIPESIRPDCPEGHPCQLSEEEFAAVLQQELVALRHEITALRESAKANGVEGRTGPQGPQPVTAEQTIAYWNRLRNIAHDETELQRRAQAALNNVNADNAFALRGRVSEFAAKAVEAIPSEGVDEELVQFGRQLAEWYVRASVLYHRAARLWSDRNAQESAAQLTHQWETSERQLRNEADLLGNKAESVRAALARRYEGEFSGFGG
jgi:hypothetical protein